MLIKRHVFLEIIKQKPHIKYRNDIDGYSGYGDNFYDFFPAKINQETKKFESEDYGFCRIIQQLNYKVYCDISVRLNHIGQFNFCGNVVEQLKNISNNKE